MIPGATVTTVVADVFDPSVLVARMIADPFATAVTRPLEETVAIAELLEDHDTDLLVAFDGITDTDNCEVSAGANDTVVGFNVSPMTVTTGAVTITVADAVTLEPSVLAAVIVATPVPTAVTIPPDTVATDELLVDHDSVLVVAFTGRMDAVKEDVCEVVRARVVELSVIPVTTVTFNRAEIAFAKFTPLILPQPVQTSYPLCAE